MPIVHLIEHDTTSYGVKIGNNELGKIQKLENNYEDENNILFLKPLETFLGEGYQR